MSQTSAKLQQKVDRVAGEEDDELRLGEESAECAGLSVLVRVERDEVRGRFAVADKKIPPGTIIAVADPTVALLNPDDKELVQAHCLRCLRPCPAPHPCLTCCEVVFCSPQCREASAKGRVQSKDKKKVKVSTL